MRSEVTPISAPLPLVDEPVIVMAVSDVPTLAKRVRSVAAFIPGVSVVDVHSCDAAIETIESLYESPRGCPDLLLVDVTMRNADDMVRQLALRCPGVRVLQFLPSTKGTALEEKIRAGVQHVLDSGC